LTDLRVLVIGKVNFESSCCKCNG